MGYEGRSKSSRPDLVQRFWSHSTYLRYTNSFIIIIIIIRMKLKYYLLLIVAMLRTRHVQYDFWAINILYISAYEQNVCPIGVEMLTPELVLRGTTDFAPR